MNLHCAATHDEPLMELTYPPPHAAALHANCKQSNVNSVMNLRQNHVYIIKKGIA